MRHDGRGRRHGTEPAKVSQQRAERTRGPQERPFLPPDSDIPIRYLTAEPGQRHALLRKPPCQVPEQRDLRLAGPRRVPEIAEPGDKPVLVRLQLRSSCSWFRTFHDLLLSTWGGMSRSSLAGSYAALRGQSTALTSGEAAANHRHRHNRSIGIITEVFHVAVPPLSQVPAAIRIRKEAVIPDLSGGSYISSVLSREGRPWPYPPVCGHGPSPATGAARQRPRSPAVFRLARQRPPARRLSGPPASAHVAGRLSGSLGAGPSRVSPARPPAPPPRPPRRPSDPAGQPASPPAGYPPCVIMHCAFAHEVCV